ncbi:hypothetical protein HYH03_008976 [Edaphochlamys debaryana]|uniref:DUF155 domain-containing protein n=1 Tax=Edaphochlamys debaryana TaxID=47281 RepID=A0A835Y194_9CHLO|nr:hypothetical protein HYH03_008976 [Edaphochlamys debaryana]|eukprot:KAG2492818.1 hypothetical protein HYH03_008976 [Edaphochlamys debaryana]
MSGQNGPRENNFLPKALLRRAVSPSVDSRRGTVVAPAIIAAQASNLTAIPAPAASVRARRFVPLPDANKKPQIVAEELNEGEDATLSDVPSEALPPVMQKRGRITVITVAESFNRKALEAALCALAATSAAAPSAAAAPAAIKGPGVAVTGGTPSPTPTAAAASANAAAAAASLAASLSRSHSGPAPLFTTPSLTAGLAGNGNNTPPNRVSTPGNSTHGAGAAMGMVPGAAHLMSGGSAAPPPPMPSGGSMSSGGGSPAVTTAVTAYPEVVYARTVHGEAVEAPGEVYFFDYGVVALWGMTESQEQALLASVLRCRGVAVEPLDDMEKQAEEMLFEYTKDARPNISNDTWTIDSRQANDPLVKMAISHAVAQSTKLAVYEERMVALVEEVRDVPSEMAEKGSISMSRRKVAKLMGKVFLLKAAVNLTATMLDIPEFFWRAPDQLQALYEQSCQYLDIQTRLDMVNARFMVLQRMLDIWSNHSAHQHLARLDATIIVLILIEVVMAAMEVVGFIMRRRGWTYHGPKLWELIWGRHHPHPHAHAPPPGALGLGMGLGMGLDAGQGGWADESMFGALIWAGAGLGALMLVGAWGVHKARTAW